MLLGTSRAVHGSDLTPPLRGGTGLTPHWGTRIPHAAGCIRNAKETDSGSTGDILPPGAVFADNDWDGGDVGIQGVEAEGAAKYPTMRGTPYPSPALQQQIIIWVKMSVILKLRNTLGNNCLK